MKWLGMLIELDTNSTLIAIFIFSLLSVTCSTFTIIIYFKMKNLRTLVYRFFFHVAFNEWLSRISYLLLFIIDQSYNIYAFRISATFIYFSDTNIVLLTAFACFGMYQLILKQNNKLAEKFNKISLFLYGASAIITIIFFCISIKDEMRDTNIYRNIICLFFIVDKDKYAESLPGVLFSNIIYLLILIFSFVCIFLIQAFVKDRGNIPSNMESEESIIKDKSIKSSLKLRTFKLKLLSYPFLNFAYIIPLSVYLWIEYAYLANNEKYQENMRYLRIRYIFYNIYCFMNSIRGFLYFRVFIDNEKIKMYLFKNFLFFDLFKTIDQINEEEELSNENSSKMIEAGNIASIEKEINNNFNKNENDLINSTSKRSKSQVIKKDSELVEMDSKSKVGSTKTGLINDEDDDSDSSDDSDDETKKITSKN